MSQNAAARNAYWTVRHDFMAVLRPRNSSRNVGVEISSWDDVEPTIDEDAKTFRVRISNLDNVPWGLPATGDGYQVLGTLDGWHGAPSSQIIHDATTDSHISAPSRWEGTLIVSYRWTLGTWLRAWAYWAWRRLLQVLAWVLVLAVLAAVGWLLWQVPWTALLGLFTRDTVVPTPTPMPTPMPHVGGRPPRVGNN